MGKESTVNDCLEKDLFYGKLNYFITLLLL